MPIQFMTSPKYLLTSESVTEGHPDKLCDQISDAVLDAALRGDPMSRVACETVATKNLIMVTGEITTKSELDFDDIARGVMRQIGYTHVSYGIDGNSCGVIAHVSQQSPDISSGVSTALEERGSGASDARRATGAGDQGMMVGFACDETDGLMPITVDLSHRLVERLSAVRKDGLLDYLGPDGKSQVTVEYSNGKPKRVDAVVISSQHMDSDDRESFTKKIRSDILEHVIRPIVPVRAAGRQHSLLRQSQRLVRCWRPTGGHRPHRTQNPGRHLRWHCSPRWWRVLWQGSDQGRPFWRLRSPLRSQEPRGGWVGSAYRGHSFLRHRRGGAHLCVSGDIRHRSHRQRSH